VRSKQLTSHSTYFILYSLANTRLIFRMCSEQYTELIAILFFKVTKYNQRAGPLIQGNTFMQAVSYCGSH